MKLRKIACLGMTFMASLSVMKASTTVLSGWTFGNLSSGTTNVSPQPSSGSGSAAALGMANSYNNTNSLSNPVVVTAPTGSASGDANSWQISGNGAQPNGGDGWSTNAPIGTQGAQFSANTYGFYRVMVSFNVYVPSTGEANMQVQYTTEGHAWTTVGNITSAGSAVIENNSTSSNTVMGAYLKLSSGWNNNITVDLSGLSGADNNPNFAIRLVNASTGTDDVDTTGAVYNNTSGNWTLDDVVILGTSIDTIADWTFLLYGSGPYSTNAGYVENPIPDLNFAYQDAASAACIGFDIPNFNFGSGNLFSTNAPDVTTQSGSSTPNNPYCWRARGAPGNGWTSIAPIASQGVEFDVSTINYSNIILTFDIYFTSAAEAKMCVVYTTNGWTNSFTANTLAYAPNPQYILTNDQTADPNTVKGAYFFQTAGQNWYNQLAVDFTGLPNVDNNPYFGIRIVNASSNGDVVAYNDLPYNNSSGNARFGNVAFGGQYNGLTPPVVSAAANVTVDNPFTNTFTDDPNWRASIAAIYVNGAQLTNGYDASNPGMLIFSPSQSTLLQLAAVDSIVIYATNYSTVRFTQPIAAGKFQSLTVPIQTLGPSASGGTLEVNPVLMLSDQYGNTTTNPYANVSVQALAGGASGWILGGATNQQEVNGVIEFTNLSATLTGTTPVTGAALTLIVSGYTNSATLGTTTNITLSPFNIGAAPVPFTPGDIAALQVDTLSNNTTFSMIEVKGSTASQTTPVNIVPVSATGTNSLRESPAGSTGRLALSLDGTLLTFAAFADGSAATPDETFNLNRAAVGMNYTNGLTVGATYSSTSLGGSQARAACTADDVNYFIDDKGGLYFGTGYLPYANINFYNNVVVKCFGPQTDLANPPSAYVETQKAISGLLIPNVYEVYDNSYIQPNNLGTDPNATDFYMISTNCGTSYDVMYTCDGISAKKGIINKFSWGPNVDSLNPNNGYGWTNSGTWTNTVGIDGMFVTTNGMGEAYIYYTTGAGGTGGNSIYRITDSAGWNANIHIISTNLLYTSPGTASIKGLVFTPQQTANAYEPMPTPVLTAQSKLGTNAATFSIALSPDDSVWRSSITAITVNGTVLPTSAYSTTTAGQVKFTPAQAPILQTPGTRTIVFSATGY
ncbi:MAG TPA: hemoblobin-interacting domain-containing protein, partial [Verrucomicrobiae bacterium]|nr:hemoblobin-interacting domain-containing protein [Verrucomicrobiae bacterium]